jgi:membrane protein implicated in regulation of membrane protease activity
MSKRNLAWLIAIVAAGVIGWLVGGWLVAVIMAVVVLVVSEVVERTLRRRRVAASGGTVPSVRDAVGTRRRRPGAS